MDVLIIGGTVFLGRHVAREALTRGARVTLFHRGRHALEPGAFDDVLAHGGRLEVVQGDRREGFEALAGRTWDAAIDTSGYTPQAVIGAVEALGSRTGHYTLVSSISVYPDYHAAGITEDARLAPLTEAERQEGERLDRENPEQLPRFYELYGPLKAACERELMARLPDRALVVRPGLIVGPDDPTDRFTYWPDRAARGGEILAPGSPSRPVQFIDVRDLAAWMVALASSRTTGTYHATGPAQPLEMGGLIETCIEVASSRATGQAADARVTWCDESYLLEQGVKPWSELPLWIPDSDPAMRGFMRVDCGRAIASGLTFRALERTVRDTLDWSSRRPHDVPRKAGMTSARERELLERRVAPISEAADRNT